MTTLAVDPETVHAAQEAARIDRAATAQIVEAVSQAPANLVGEGGSLVELTRRLAEEFGVTDRAARSALWMLRERGVLMVAPLTGEVRQAG